MRNSEIDYHDMGRSRVADHTTLLLLLSLFVPVSTRQVCLSKDAVYRFVDSRLTSEQGALELQRIAQVHESGRRSSYRICSQRRRNTLRRWAVGCARGICVAEPPDRRREVQGYASTEFRYVSTNPTPTS